MSFPKSLACFTGVMLLSLSAAKNLGGSYGEGAGFGPWGVPDATYNKLMDTPNATSKYPLPAPDTSVPYPASGPADGWSLAVSVVADIAMSESKSTTVDGHENQTFTGSRVVLQAPAGSDAAVDESWFVCAIHWDLDLDNYPAKLRGDDGTCSSVLSEQCIRDVEARSIEQYSSDYGSLSPCPCPTISDIPSCQGEQAKILMAGGGCIAREANATTIRDWPGGELELRRYGGPPHERGNQTAYNETGSLAWPVLVMWGPSDNSTRSSSGLLDLTGAAAKMLCPRAKDATQGSTAPGSGVGDTSAGSREAGLSSLVLVVSVLLVAAGVIL